MANVTFNLNPYQERFLMSDAQFPALVSAWASGKTLAGILKVMLHCERYPNNLALIVRKTFVNLKDSTMRDFKKYTGITPDSYANVNLPNGSVIMFRHAEQLEDLQNYNLGIVMIEQAEEFDDASQFTMLRGRMRRDACGIQPILIIANTAGNNWIKRMWKVNPQKLIPEVRYDPEKDELVETGNFIKGFELFEATTFDNAKNLSSSFLSQLMSLKETDHNTFQRLVMNSWDISTGRIFQVFDRKYHVIPKGDIPKDWPSFCAIDPAVGSGVFCWGLFRLSPIGDIICQAEYYDSNKVISEHAKCVKAILNDLELEPGYWVIDPSAFVKNQQARHPGKLYALKDELEEEGIYCMRAENAVDAGINRVQEYLKIDYSKKHPYRDMYGSPHLFFMENCVHIIEEMENYREVPNKLTVRGDRRWEPYKHNDHGVDVVRYMAMSRISPDYQHDEVTHFPRWSVAQMEKEAEEARTARLWW